MSDRMETCPSSASHGENSASVSSEKSPAKLNGHHEIGNGNGHANGDTVSSKASTTPTKAPGPAPEAGSANGSSPQSMDGGNGSAAAPPAASTSAEGHNQSTPEGMNNTATTPNGATTNGIASASVTQKSSVTHNQNSSEPSSPVCPPVEVTVAGTTTTSLSPSSLKRSDPAAYAHLPEHLHELYISCVSDYEIDDAEKELLRGIPPQAKPTAPSLCLLSPSNSPPDYYSWPLNVKTNGFDPARELFDTVMYVWFRSLY